MDLNIIDIMAPAFFECLVLVGIHSFLGLHVLRRKVIFVDLALAQIAALGTTVGFLFGIMPGSTGAYWFSLFFTIIGAAVFSISRIRHEKIPQEAVIGLAYAVAASISILVIDKAPQGAEHIKEILTGSILWVKWETIGHAAIVYSIIGAFHFLFRKQFLLISENPDEAYKRGMNVRFWDFLFYMSFGVVITHSVGTAGVLLVFVFLVVPAIGSMLLTDVLWKQLLIGWGMGVIVSVIGLAVSFEADLPSGPTVVAVYGVVLVVTTIGLYLFKAEKLSTAIGKVAVGTAGLFAVVGMLLLMAEIFSGEESHHHGEAHKIETEFSDTSESKMSESGGENPSAILISEFEKSEDDLSRIEIAQKVFEYNKQSGAKLYLKIMTESELPFIRSEVVGELRKITGNDFDFNPELDSTGNKLSIRKWKNWIEHLDPN